MKILVIDNYDSFTYNLVQLLGRFDHELVIKRNDEITESEISELKPDKILISPGPGKPEDSKITLTAIEKFGSKIPVLGVCLGHQAIVLMHGKTSLIKHDGKKIFNGIPQEFEATRYHSLIVDRETLPDSLEISAETNE